MERRRNLNLFQLLALIVLITVGRSASADQPWSTSVDGRLFEKNTTNPLKDTSLVFILQFLNPARNCVLYEERQVYDTNLSNGYFSLKVGSALPDPSGKRTSSDPGYGMAKIFNNTLNSFPATTGCGAGYTPSDGDVRYLRVIVQPTAGTAEALSPDIAITSVPSAKVAETVGGLERSQILAVRNTGGYALTQTNLESIFNSTQLPILTALLGGTSNLYMRQGANGTAVVPGIAGNAPTPSAGQIWYDTTSNQLKYQSNSGPQTLGVAGAGISSVTAGTGLNVGAGPGGSITSSGTLNVNVGTGDGQIVQVQTGGKLPVLDGSNLTHLNGSSIEGNISITGTINSGAITSSGNIAGANLTATNSVTANDARLNALRVYKPSTTNYVEFVADAALSSQVVFTLPTALGTNGQVLQTDASGKLSWTSISNVPGGSAGGDLGGNYPNPSVNAVRGNPVASGTLAVGDTGKVYRWSGTQFEAVNFGVDDLRTEAGLQQFATNCGADQTLTWSTITDAFACTTIGIAGTQITSGTINSARLPTIDPTKGGTGLTALGTSNQVLGVNNAGSAMEYKSITGGAGVTITHSAGGIQVSATGSGGTVTNVTGTAPISVTNNTSTPAIAISQANTSTDGYLSAADWNTFNSKQAAGNYLTGLTGDVVATGPGSVSATIQANAITTGKINNLAVTDAKINDVAWSKITGVPALLSAVNTAGTSNQIFGMNAAGTAGEYKSITGGSGVTITHSVNGIEVSATGSGGTVTGVTAGTGLNVGAGPGGTINGSGTLNIDVGTTTGKIVQVAAGNKLPAIDGSDLTNLNASNLASGTVPTARLPVVPIANGGTGQTTANAALNALLPSQALNSGKVLQTNGTDTSWVTPNAGTVTNVSGTAPISVTSNTTTPSISISQATTSTDGYLSSADWNMFNGKASASSLNNYVLKAGDTMTGALALPSNGLTVGTNQLTVSGGNVGVGTTNPSRKLHVRADGAYQLRLENASAGGGYWNIAQSDSTFGSGGQKLLFIPDVDTSTSATVVFTNAGRVGIGNINPTESLDVTGKIKGTELCIGTDCRAAWPTGAGGTVTSVTSANTDISVATTTTTPILTLNTGTGANQILKLNGSSEIPAVSGANLTNLNASSLTSGTLSAARLPALTGDVTSSAGSNSITLNTVPVSKGGTGSTTIQANKLVSTGATGTAWTPFSCAAGEVVKFDGSGVLGCSTIATMLGYTPANGANYVSKSGDTISGGLTIDGPAQGLTLKSSGDHVYLGLFADADAPSTRSGWVGYGTAGTSNLTIANEMTGGPIHLSTASTPRMAIDANGGVGIGTTSPNASSLLEVTSTTKGFLPPRMTRAQRNAISSPAQGLMVFNTDDNTIDYYNGAAWLALNGSPKYIKMLMSNYQTIGAGSIVTFDTVAVNSGFTTTGYGINLKAGVTYRLEAMLNTYAATGNNYVGYQLHNGTSYIGQAAYSSESEQTSYGFKAGVMEIYKPTVDQTITLRIMDANLGTGQVTPYYNTYLIATELVPAGPAGGGGNDNLGNHTASQNINLGTNWISPDGTAKGLRLAANGSLGVNNAAPTEALDVTGKVKATELCIGADCRAAWPSGAGGTVTSVTSANADIAVATTTTTPVLTLNTGTGANQILKLNASSEIPAVSGANLTNLNANNIASGTLSASRLPAFTGGDVTSSAGSAALTLNTVPVSKGGTGSTTIQANKLVSTGATGTAWTPFSCSVGEVVKFDGSGVLGCSTIATMLGYTPANGANYVAKAGDTMTGTLNLPSNGLVVGTNQIVAASGRVGIATASPSSLLTLNAGSNDGLRIDNGTVNGVIFNTANNSMTVGTVSNHDLGLYTNNTQKVTVQAGGNVGIGTTSPSSKLHVAGSTPAFVLQDTSTTTASNALATYVSFKDSSGTEFGWVGDGGGTDNDMRLRSTSGNAHLMTSGGSLTLLANGAVGIGTSSPTQKLHISSGDTSYALFGPNTTWNSYLKVGSGNISAQANVAGVISTNGNLHLDSGAGQDVYVQHVTGRNTYMNLNGGNVGIGSSGPNAKLTVSTGSQNGITSYITDGTYHAVHGSNSATGAWGSLGYSNYGIYCIGNCGGNTGWNNFSDRRLKEHISPLKSSLEKVTSLQGVEYDWKDEKQRKLSGHQIGLIAQDVEKVFPEAVKTDKNNKQLEGGVKSLEYTMLIAPMIEAIKELHAKVQKMFSGQEQIQREVASVKAENEKLKQENAAIKAYLCAKDPKAPICQSEPSGR